jgi:beta-glucosidase
MFFMRNQLTDRSSIPGVIAQLTLEEKANLVGAYTACHTFAIPDMKIPAISLTDGVTGVNGCQVVLDYATANERTPAEKREIFSSDEPFELPGKDLDELRAQYAGNRTMTALVDHISATRPDGAPYISFPSGINIGASFSTETAGKLGQAVGWEMRHAGVDITLGPNVDVMRDPLGGRNYEMYGEDPELVAQMGASFIQGIQSTGVGACAKHFIANNQETNRTSKNELMSERTLREIYSRGFIGAVKKGKVKSIMSAYNAINGTFSSYNKMLLTDWLRGEWGFDGLIVSDWGAASHDKEQSLLAGMDLILCGPNDMSEVVKAVEEGILPMEVLDKRVSRVLSMIVQLKEEQAAIPAVYEPEQLQKAAYDALVDGAVLLKNEGELLPLETSAKVTFYGRRSKELLEFGSGSTAVPTVLHSNPYDATEKLLGYAPLYETMDGADTLIYTVTAPAGENVDREAMDIEPEDRERLPQILKEAKEKGLRTVVLLNISGPVEMRSWLEYADSVLCIFIPGCMGGTALADLLYGKAAPGGRLPVTFPVRYEDTPSYPNFPGEYTSVYYGEGVFVGYRSYEKRKLPVQFPFGYGLTYTRFETEPVEKALTFDTEKNDSILVPIRIRNTGSRPGSAVIQLYAAEKKPHILRPEKELCGFGKLLLQPGEEKVLQIPVEKDALCYFDDKLGRTVCPVGSLTLYAGTSSADLFGKMELEVLGEKVYLLGADSTVADIVKNPEAVALIDRYTGGAFSAAGDQLKMMAQQKIGNYLAQQLIAKIPDSVQLGTLLDQIYAELGRLDN